MSARPRTTVCHVCWGDDITVNDKGRLVRHHERIVTKDGVTNGGFICDGSGQPAQEQQDVSELLAERYPRVVDVERERWQLGMSSKRNEGM